MLASEKQTLVITINNSNEINIYYGNGLEDEGRNSLNSFFAMALVLLLIIKPLPRKCCPS